MLIGVLIGMLGGILTIIGPPLVNVLGNILSAQGGLVMGLIEILFALIALVNSGFLKIKALDFGKTKLHQ